MAWIQNVSLADIERACHFDPGMRGILIQIVDHDMNHPIAPYPFKEIHQFKFLDIEDDPGVDLTHAISDQQAKDIAFLLQRAVAENANVIVHCVAGVCRSGAVAEVGVMLGLQDTETHRQPNTLVKKKLMKALDLYPTFE